MRVSAYERGSATAVPALWQFDLAVENTKAPKRRPRFSSTGAPLTWSRLSETRLFRSRRDRSTPLFVSQSAAVETNIRTPNREFLEVFSAEGRFMHRSTRFAPIRELAVRCTATTY